MSETLTAEEVARRAAEAAQPKPQQEGQKAEAPTVEAMARESADHQVRQAEALWKQRARLEAFEAEQKRQADDARQHEERKRQAEDAQQKEERKRQAEDAQQQEERKREAESRRNQAEAEIRDAGDRYRIALGQHYDVKDPYASLARAAMGEYGAFIRDREQLTQQIAKEQNAEARKALELRKEIEANDYMAITSRRIASQSEVITGRRDSEEAVRFRERATDYEAQNKELRQQYRDMATARAERAAEEHERHRRQDQGTPGASPQQPGQQPGKTAPKETAPRDDSSGKGEMSDAKAERKSKVDDMLRSANERANSHQTGRTTGGGGRSGR